jgi:Zn-dependent protease
MSNNIQLEKKDTSNKFGVFLVFFKVLLKSSKFLKFTLAGASFAAYSYMFTWEFAGMLLFMIFIHELGHVIAMKQCGIKVKGIYLIPFLGGAAVSEGDFKSRRDESYVALMGPWFGLLVSLLLALLYYITNYPVFAAGATWCSLINLFNLLPVNPLDGGRVVKSLAFSAHGYVGMLFLLLSLIGMIVIIVKFHIWLFLVLLIVAVLELLLESYIIFKKKKKVRIATELKERINSLNMQEFSEENQKQINQISKELDSSIDEISEKPKMSLRQILIYGVLYLLTCYVFLELMNFTSHLPGCKEAFEALQ